MKKRKTLYEKALLDIVLFEMSDVITTSGAGENDGTYDDSNSDDNLWTPDRW